MKKKRPATGLASVMLAEGWYDRDFVRDWTNGSLLIREDTGRLLAASDLSPDGHPAHYVAWDRGAARPVPYDPAAGRFLTTDARTQVTQIRGVRI